jgi:hypothetical protein
VRKHFSEYFRPTVAETKSLWAEAVFIFDTNILLNVYRMSRETSLQMMEILTKLKGRLFLPNQVGVEFFNHREEEIAKQVNAFERVKQSLNRIPEGFKKDFLRHPCIPITEITEALKECVDKQIAIVNQSQLDNQLNFLAHDDPILPELDSLFTDSGEEPYMGADDDTLNRKVEDRFQMNLPPCAVSTGEKVSSTSNPHRGDGRVWFQIVKHAEKTKKTIIFITGDERKNWWRTAKLGNKERIIGPHFMLIRDVESASEKRFLMYTQEQFLSEAPQYLDVPEQTKGIEEVTQIRESASTEKDVELTDEPKTSFFEESESLDKPHIGQESGLREKRRDLDDEPKASPLQESKIEQKSEFKEEVD